MSSWQSLNLQSFWLGDTNEPTSISCQAQKEGKSDSELDEIWWKQAGELVAGYYKQREEVEKDVEGPLVFWVFMFWVPDFPVDYPLVN